MKKQFDLLEKIYAATDVSNIKIAALKKKIEEEYSTIRRRLIEAYSHNDDIMFLVCFEPYAINFHKATTKRLHEVRLTWYTSESKIGVPKTFDEATKLLETISNPTNCEIRSYQEFRYFSDIDKKWDRIDWITKETYERRFLFEVTEKDFTKALDIVYSFYAGGKK